MTFSLFAAAGYFLFSGIGNIGDWAEVVAGWRPAWAWRVGLTVLGTFTYFLLFVPLCVRELRPFLGRDQRSRLRRARQLTLVPYLTSGILSYVAGAFNPWNYPAVIIARKLSAALVAGCPVILKAAEETPSTAIAVANAIFDAGLPRNVLQVLFGKPAEISSVLLASPIVRVMSFTGSTLVGKQLARMAAVNLIRHVLELGGHSPVVIGGDADVASAATAVAAYKYDCAGQSCNAPSRVFIERAAYDDFVAAFVEISRKIRIGEGWQPHVNMGPLANARRIVAMDNLVSDAKEGGHCSLRWHTAATSRIFLPAHCFVGPSRERENLCR
jgi:delta 1-pyrroline-5-carboxylate dehydrogenase